METSRLNISISTREEMEQFISLQTNDILKAAYSEMLDGCLKHPDQWEWYAIWMIELKDGTHIGELSFKGFNNGFVEIGYGINEDYQNQGYATEAVQAITEWAIKQPNVKVVEAEAEQDNKASLRVLRKTNFFPTGLIGEEGPRFVYIPKDKLIEALQDKNDKKAYEIAKEICTQSAESNEYYSMIDDFSTLLNAKSSYVRARGFMLSCSQSRWDTQGKLQETFSKMSALLHDEKPTVVRQCLNALHELALYRPELSDLIIQEINTIDLSKYKDSMVPLIQKDIKALMELLEN